MTIIFLTLLGLQSLWSMPAQAAKARASPIQARASAGVPVLGAIPIHVPVLAAPGLIAHGPEFSSPVEAAPEAAPLENLVSGGRQDFDQAAIPGLNSIVAELSVHAPTFRPHPDAVDVMRLRAGDVITVLPRAFRHLPSIATRIQHPVEMRVASVMLDTTRSWRKSKAVAYLEHPAIGKIGIELWRLDDYGYTQPDFSIRAPFKKGEYVDIDISRNVEFRDKAPEGGTLQLTGARGYIGRYVGVEDKDHYIVEIQVRKAGISSLYIVPRLMVSALPAGTESAVGVALAGLKSMRFPFAEGEEVRFRNSKGLMETGLLLDDLGETKGIVTVRGSEVMVPASRVFKIAGEAPSFTPLYRDEWIQARFRKPHGLLADVLDGAARISSHPDFSRMPPLEKLRMLMRYVQRILPWTESGSAAENAGLTTFNQLIRAGAGVCRHNATLLATMLSEAGYMARLVHYVIPHGNGHAWVEASMASADGRVETYVVDPTEGFIEPLWKVRKLAMGKTTLAQTANTYYLNPERRYSPIRR